MKAPALLGFLLACLTGIVSPAAEPASPIDIGSRRELFVDATLIDSLQDARRQLHHPIARELAIHHDAPWEGAGCNYHSIIRDGDLYRLYYRGTKLAVEEGRLKLGREVYCYAESRDGLTFTKPDLGLHEFEGSTANNIIWTGVGTHNFAPFLDTRPDCPPESRFKALAGQAHEGGLFAFQSPDGIRWSLIRPEPVVTEGAFDSQNLAFWDAAAGKYRAYFRTFTAGVTTGKVWKPEGFRAIRTASSDNFLDWQDEADLTYTDSPTEHLYTNQIGPYFRAPHLLLGFPARYVERGWSDSMRALPEPERREQRAAAHLRYGTALTEGLLMASRDGVHFERWNEAFLRPGPQRPDTWLYGHQFIAWHAVPTASSLPGADDEISLYATEGSWHDDSNGLRRYTLRLDGFVSVTAPLTGGELITKPLIFQGDTLSLNFASSAAGDLRVELQTVDGTPIPGFTLDDCPPIFGDSVDRQVVWSAAPATSDAATTVSRSLAGLANQPIRMRFHLRDADLYSFQFATENR